MYVAESRTLWVLFPDADGDTLLTHEDTAPYARALLAGAWDGEPLESVRFVFTSPEAASYNADSLAFLRIETWMEGSPRQKFGEEPEFTVREDGIPGCD
jgi:hypothetical protein